MGCTDTGGWLSTAWFVEWPPAPGIQRSWEHRQWPGGRGWVVHRLTVSRGVVGLRPRNLASLAAPTVAERRVHRMVVSRGVLGAGGCADGLRVRNPASRGALVVAVGDGLRPPEISLAGSTDSGWLSRVGCPQGGLRPPGIQSSGRHRQIWVVVHRRRWAWPLAPSNHFTAGGRRFRSGEVVLWTGGCAVDNRACAAGAVVRVVGGLLYAGDRGAGGRLRAVLPGLVVGLSRSPRSPVRTSPSL
jgi:hypothetical protein